MNLYAVNAAVQPSRLSAEEYLAEEEASAVRHEYVRGYLTGFQNSSSKSLPKALRTLIVAKNCWKYLRIETLEEYVLIAQDRAEITVFRRSNDWKAQVVGDANAQVILDSLKMSLDISAI